MKKINEILNQSPLSKIIESEKLKFSGVGKKDVYNISKKFIIGKEEFLFGRVEPRDNSELSKVFLFRKFNCVWIPDRKFIPLENSEDPFISKIGNEFVLGCVEVERTDEIYKFNSENELDYRTVFYKGKNPWNLKRFFDGPWRMKDIRFVQLHDKRIAVFSRPQGGKYGRGKIGFLIINSLGELTEDLLYNAKLLKCFYDDEWGGVNDIYALNEPELLVLGHIAKRNRDSSLSYYPILFTFNFETGEHSDLEIIFKREHLGEGESKNEKLVDVIFPGGFEINCDGTVDLYVGAGDAESCRVRIKNPF